MFSASSLRTSPPRIRSLALCLGLGLALSAPLHAQVPADLYVSGGGGGGGGGGGSCGAANSTGTGGGGGGGGGLGSGGSISDDDYQGGGGGGGSGSGTLPGNSIGGIGGAGTFPGGLRGGQTTGRADGTAGGGAGTEGGGGGKGGVNTGAGGAGGVGDVGFYGIWSSGLGGSGGSGTPSTSIQGNPGVNGSDGGGGGGGSGGNCVTTADFTRAGGKGGYGAWSGNIFLLDSLFNVLTVTGGTGGDGGTPGSTNGGGGGGGGSVQVDGSIGLEAATLTVAGGDGGRGNVAPVAKEGGGAAGEGGPGGQGSPVACTGGSNDPGCYGYGGGGGNAMLTASYPGSGHATIIVTDTLTVRSGSRYRASNSYGGGYGGAVTFDTDSLDAPPITNVIKQSGAVSFHAGLMNVVTPNSAMNLSGTVASDVNIGQMDFYLPDTLTGAPMLTVTGALDIANTGIEVGIASSSSPLKVGDRIVLISGSGVTNGLKNATSAGSGMTLQDGKTPLPSHYKFDISRQGNQIVATVTQVPPVLTNKIINPAITEADFSVVSNLDATGYWFVTLWTSTCPDAASIISDPRSAHGTMTAGAPYPFTWNGLNPDTYYTICLVADGTAGSPNYSAVWQGQFKTGQASAPILTDLEVDKASITANSANFSATSDTTGTGYWLALPDGEEMPGGRTGSTSDFVSAATGQNNTTGMVSNRAESRQLTGLTPDTVYVLYFIATDSSGTKYSAIRTASFKTLALPVALAGAIPTLGNMALALLALLLAGSATAAIRRRH